MAQARVATELDRLPWLKDEREPQRTRGFGWLVFWGILALAVIAAASFWAGLNNAPGEGVGAFDDPLGSNFLMPEPDSVEEVTPVAPAPPAPAPAMPQVQEAPAPPPVALPRTEEVRIARPERAAKPAKRTASAQKSRTVAKKRSASSRKAKAALRPWSAWQSDGAAGRVVRVGTFASPRQAKRGWVRIARTYPITRLPAVVVGSRSLRNGRTYYRLQIGTTSQAHSEVLCQRMRIVGQSCVVIGLKG